MLTVYYFLQVAVCSALLYAYYLFALRNKSFHQYNRFYLLTVLVASWLIPLIKIPVMIAASPVLQSNTPFRFFEVIADNNSHFEDYVLQGASSFSWENVIVYGYILVSCLIACAFISGMMKLLFMLKNNSSLFIDNAVLILTDAKSAPFTFLHFVFWNNKIDISSSVGKQVLTHEMVHVKEKHSYDNIFSAIVLCAGWWNPIFWFTKKELHMVHEFIADRKAVNGNATELAHMLLATTYPMMNFNLTDPFFYSPVKRRILMMTKFKISGSPYLRRLLVLPLLAIIVTLFAFRKQVADIVSIDPADETVGVQKGSAIYPETAVTDLVFKERTDVSFLQHGLSRVYNLVIDPGHGGQDRGATAADGTTEAAIALEIAKVIKDINTNEKLNIILTREDDVYMSPVAKSAFTVNNKADLFISVHVNTAMEAGISTENGIEVVLPKFDTAGNYKQSYILANAIGTYMEKLNPKTTLKSRQTGIWVLQHAKCPAALIECGYLSNKKDLANLKSKPYQQKLAIKILEAAEHYLHYAEEKK